VGCVWAMHVQKNAGEVITFYCYIRDGNDLALVTAYPVAIEHQFLGPALTNNVTVN
jgi:hypothetical protein